MYAIQLFPLVNVRTDLEFRLDGARRKQQLWDTDNISIVVPLSYLWQIEDVRL